MWISKQQNLDSFNPSVLQSVISFDTILFLASTRLSLILLFHIYKLRMEYSGPMANETYGRPYSYQHLNGLYDTKFGRTYGCPYPYKTFLFFGAAI